MGGGGFDRAAYAFSPVGVTVPLLLQNHYHFTGFNHDMLVSIENLSGTVYTDRLTGDGNSNVCCGASTGTII